MAEVAAVVKTEEAKQAVAQIQAAVSSGGSTSVSVTKTVEVVKASNKITGESIIVSVVKLSVAAKDSDLKDVEIIEVIPKDTASNVDQVTFIGEKPAILEADPVVKWSFSEVKKGQTRDLSYTVNKDIRLTNSTTLAVGSKVAASSAVTPPPAPAVPEGGSEEERPPVDIVKPTKRNTLILVFMAALIPVAGWLFIRSRRSGKKAMK